jgi:hypothetical protein
MLTRILKQDGLVQLHRFAGLLLSGQAVDGYVVVVRVHEGRDLKAATAAFEKAVAALKV